MVEDQIEHHDRGVERDEPLDQAGMDAPRPVAQPRRQPELLGRAPIQTDHGDIGRRRDRAAGPEQPAQPEPLLERRAGRRQQSQRPERRDRDAAQPGAKERPYRAQPSRPSMVIVHVSSPRARSRRNLGRTPQHPVKGYQRMSLTVVNWVTPSASPGYGRDQLERRRDEPVVAPADRRACARDGRTAAADGCAPERPRPGPAAGRRGGDRP